MEQIDDTRENLLKQIPFQQYALTKQLVTEEEWIPKRKQMARKKRRNNRTQTHNTEANDFFLSRNFVAVFVSLSNTFYWFIFWLRQIQFTE